MVAKKSDTYKRAKSSHSVEPGNTKGAHSMPSDRSAVNKKKKRVRNEKTKKRLVFATGEEPRERKTRKGKVREFDLLQKGGEEQTIPRKTQEFMSRLASFRGDPSNSNGQRAKGKEAKIIDNGGGKTAMEKRELSSREREESLGNELNNKNERGRKTLKASETAIKKKSAEKDRRFDGLHPGESLAHFSARLRKESRQMALEVARKDNHQREKKRLYYEKRKQAAIRRKRRKRGDVSDSDVEDLGDDDGYEAIAHLPGYWQELVRNNGKPISAKKRKRMNRAAQDEIDKVAFGEQVDRPPKLLEPPVRRGRREEQ